jgi:hypothetical protein
VVMGSIHSDHLKSDSSREPPHPHTSGLYAAGKGRKMPDEDWIKTLADGRRVKFIYQELPEDGAFITAQIAGNEVVYSIVLAKARNPLSREDVEKRFAGELSKK